MVKLVLLITKDTVMPIKDRRAIQECYKLKIVYKWKVNILKMQGKSFIFKSNIALV